MKSTSNYKIENYTELNNERLKSLFIFYLPLLDDTSINLYLKLASLKLDNGDIKSLISKLNTNLTSFNSSINELSKYNLVQILENNDEYIFAIISPLSTYSFVRHNIYSKLLIKKIGGINYQNILIDNCLDLYNHKNYKNVSVKPNLDDLNNWNENDEKFNSIELDKINLNNSLFNINYFLKNTSTLILPTKYRSNNNLNIIAYYGDLYGVNEKEMKKFIKDNIFDDSNSINKNQLIFNIESGFKYNYNEFEKGNYKVYNIPFLMSLQNGKEVSQIDKKLIRELKDNYHLTTEVLNVLMEYSLKKCDNRLNHNYLKKVASDLNRNDIVTSEQALEFLNPSKKTSKVKGKKSDVRPVYEQESDNKYSDEEMDLILNSMGNENE